MHLYFHASVQVSNIRTLERKRLEQFVALAASPVQLKGNTDLDPGAWSIPQSHRVRHRS
jgi:hypothetical protein